MKTDRMARPLVARVLAAAAIGGVVAASVGPGGPPETQAADAPDLCAKAGSQWSKGVVTQYPWKVISTRNNFEVKYCIVRETATNRDQAIVRFTNTKRAPQWLKVKTFFTLSSGRRVQQGPTIALVKPGEFTSQAMKPTETKPGEQVKELGFVEMLVSDKELR